MSRGSEGFLLRVSRLGWHGFALRSEKLLESCSLGLASGKSLALGNLGLPAATAQGLEAAEGAAWAEHETLRRYQQPGSAHATSAWRAPLGPWPTPPDPSILSAAVAAPGDTFRTVSFLQCRPTCVSSRPSSGSGIFLFVYLCLILLPR